MIEGIDILNKTEIMASPLWALFCLILGMVVIAVGIIIMIKVFNDNSPYKFIFGFAVFIIGVIMTGVSLFSTNTVPTGRYRYEVTIDDSVSFVELQEKYDVIEQNGKIWTLEDKEKE